jgi:hypothetical protein
MARVRQARRCSARRKNGEPCRGWAINGGRVCRMHGGAAPQVRAKAGERLLMAAAYRTLVRFAGSPAEREHRLMRRDAFPRGDYESVLIDSAIRGFGPPVP